MKVKLKVKKNQNVISDPAEKSDVSNEVQKQKANIRYVIPFKYRGLYFRDRSK